MFRLSQLSINPRNPRLIKDAKFQKLKKSLQEFPKMMELRPIIYDEMGYILGGNQRYSALLDLKYKEIPDNWVKAAENLTDAEKDRFIIADNTQFGDYDWDILNTEFDPKDLVEWGLDVPKSWIETELEEDEKKPNDRAAWFLNIRCGSEKEAQELYEKFIEDGLDVKIVL